MMTLAANTSVGSDIRSQATQNGGSGASSDVAGVVDQYRDSTGQLDTKTLARDVVNAADQSFNQADTAFRQVSAHLSQNGSVFEAARFEQDVQSQFQQLSAGGLWTPNYQSMGAQVLRDIPLLSIQWEATESAITNKGGFSAPLRTLLEGSGVEVVNGVNAIPTNSMDASAPGSNGVKNNHNGTVAQDAIADRYRAAGFEVNTEANYDTGTGKATPARGSADAVGSVRRVDIEVNVPGVRPELDAVILVESKVGYTSNSGRAAIEAAADAKLLSTNGMVRGAGEILENFGKVARPIGIALDIYSVGSAYQADGETIGDNTKRTVSGIAGSAAGGAAGAWGGAAAGAAIGSIVPVVGTAVGGVIGGIIGGIAGGFGGDLGGKAIFDWFN